MQELFTTDVIRPIRLPDLDDVVNIHMKSFPGFFLTFLGKQFLKIYYEGILVEPSGIGILQTSKGELTGFVVGYHNPSGFYSRLLRRDWMRFGLSSAPAVLKKPSLFLRLLRATAKPFETPGCNTVELSSIAVLPLHQGRGIGGQLINAFIKEAVIRGIEYIYLTTDDIDNKAARTLYEKSGFKLYRKFETREKRLMCEYRYTINMDKENYHNLQAIT
jgi:ribosomal protein S18 acetylase RimI-like enzyme